ncbi:hypothetical protein DFH09DRAFT_1076043 [Mycena vulgaris]|nr:hypothetical protein DFH09DRAFT_1076043 [Mycena vulgaris]
MINDRLPRRSVVSSGAQAASSPGARSTSRAACTAGGVSRLAYAEGEEMREEGTAAETIRGLKKNRTVFNGRRRGMRSVFGDLATAWVAVRNDKDIAYELRGMLEDDLGFQSNASGEGQVLPVLVQIQNTASIQGKSKDSSLGILENLVALIVDSSVRRHTFQKVDSPVDNWIRREERETQRVASGRDADDAKHDHLNLFALQTAIVVLVQFTSRQTSPLVKPPSRYILAQSSSVRLFDQSHITAASAYAFY